MPEIESIIQLLIMGIIIFLILCFCFFLTSKISYYKQYGQALKAKIIAFKEETKRRSNGNGSMSYVTTICPVIEYYKDGEKVLFLGTNQNYLSHEIGKEVEIYALKEDGKHFALQKDNIYVLFSRVTLIFLLIPLTFIYLNKAQIIYKVLLPFLGPLLLIPLIMTIRNTMKKNALKEGYDGPLMPLIFDKMIKNVEMIEVEDFEKSEKYIKEVKDFSAKKNTAHIFGIISTMIFMIVIYFIGQNIYLKKLIPEHKNLLRDFTTDFSKINLILEQTQQNDNLMVFMILCGFSIIILFGFFINLKEYLKNR